MENRAIDENSIKTVMEFHNVSFWLNFIRILHLNHGQDMDGTFPTNFAKYSGVQ